MPYNKGMKQVAVIIGLVIIFLIGLWQQFYGLTPLPEPPERQVTVQLAGAIDQPGVYTLDQSARLSDLIELAGGLSESADEQRINLAQKLVDGEKIVIPEIIPREVIEGETVVPAAPPGLSQNINDWLEVPGVGPATAERILDYLAEHPAATLEDLINVSGIGPKKHQDILDFFEKGR
ncbi:MAG TPA: hypothetical protein GXZ74_01045 [Tissierellia bacterium]|nr:hypothetical protein [Tissierellia bacterium]